MPGDTLSLFKAIYTAIAEMRFQDDHSLNTSLPSELANLDPIAANEVIQEKLRTLHPDEQILNLYDAICDSQSQFIGEPYHFDEDHPLVMETSEVVKQLSRGNELSLDMLPLIMDAVKKAIADRREVNALNNYIAKNRAALNEYHLKKLTEQVAQAGLSQSKDDAPITLGEFTHTQQAIALYYLFHEALGITGIDNTRLMEFAHLLSAKKIPLNKETGKENIRNSGIKSAFNKAWKKEDVNHLADLRFVLRFFKPLDIDGATGIQNAVAALEKRIAKISEKLNREKD